MDHAPGSNVVQLGSDFIDDNCLEPAQVFIDQEDGFGHDFGTRAGQLLGGKANELEVRLADIGRLDARQVTGNDPRHLPPQKQLQVFGFLWPHPAGW